MADVLCVRCGEPWEIDSIHEVAEEDGRSFADVYRVFRTLGCGEAFRTWGVSCVPTDRERRAILSEIADLLGDDVDGYCGMVEDMGL